MVHMVVSCVPIVQMVVIGYQADVRAEADGCNSVKYNLTSDTISSIFRCYPAGMPQY